MEVEGQRLGLTTAKLHELLSTIDEDLRLCINLFAKCDIQEIRKLRDGLVELLIDYCETVENLKLSSLPKQLFKEEKIAVHLAKIGELSKKLVQI
jgi:hypothetical protein